MHQVVSVATVTATDPDGEAIFRETKITQVLVQDSTILVGEWERILVMRPLKLVKSMLMQTGTNGK